MAGGDTGETSKLLFAQVRAELVAGTSDLGHKRTLRQLTIDVRFTPLKQTSAAKPELVQLCAKS